MRRILFTAPKSGSGKTTITCAIIKALMLKGLKVSAFKCGPDYIDPMFHENVLGAKSGNIDTFFVEDNFINYRLKEDSKNTDITVFEGVMGYYDGIAGVSLKASTYDVARATKTPSVLVVDCKGMSLTVVSIIKGIVEFKKDSGIEGVILNRISPVLYEDTKKIIEEEVGVKVYGYMPQITEFTLKSRHLGLVMPTEVDDLQNEIYRLAVKVLETVDVDGLIQLANTANDIKYQEPTFKTLNEKIKIGIAKDEAFCFYYKENLDLLRKMGAEIVEFSPLTDKELPPNLKGLILGGGYPEIFAKELSSNTSMKESIKNALNKGLPCIAECGGFLYLQKSLEDVKGLPYNMVGFFDGEGIKGTKLKRFGYITLSTDKETIFGKEGIVFNGHEFHYWDCTENGDVCTATKPIRNSSWQACRTKENTFAGFPHIHFYSNIDGAFNFLKCCEEFNYD